MSARVAKLEALLLRVQERSLQPRPLAAVLAAEASAEAALDEATAETTAESLDAPAATLSPVEEIDDLDDVESLKDVPLDEIPVDDVPSLDEAPELDEPGGLDQAPLLDRVPELDEPHSLDDVQEIDDVELDEPEIPISGPVSAAEPTIDDAIDAAAHQPPVTPPPESGEGLTQPQIPANVGPTMEQLGQTIPLEEGATQDFELDEPTLDESRHDGPPSSYQGTALPEAPVSQAELTVPENAREELDRVRLGETTPFEARVSSRPVISTNVVDLVSSAREFAPKSFLDLLDASLKLK